MKMYCANLMCDFEFEDNPSSAPTQICPKCGGTWFNSTKKDLGNIKLYRMFNNILFTETDTK